MRFMAVKKSKKKKKTFYFRDLIIHSQTLESKQQLQKCIQGSRHVIGVPFLS